MSNKNYHVLDSTESSSNGNNDSNPETIDSSGQEASIPQPNSGNTSRVIRVLPTPSRLHQSSAPPVGDNVVYGQPLNSSSNGASSGASSVGTSKNSPSTNNTSGDPSDFSLLGAESPMSQSIAYSMFIPRTDVPNGLKNDDAYNEYVEKQIPHTATLNRTATPHHGEAHIFEKEKDDFQGLSGKSSIPAVLGNMLNAIVGAGIVGLPYVFEQSGMHYIILIPQKNKNKVKTKQNKCFAKTIGNFSRNFFFLILYYTWFVFCFIFLFLLISARYIIYV